MAESFEQSSNKEGNNGDNDFIEQNPSIEGGTNNPRLAKQKQSSASASDASNSTLPFDQDDNASEEGYSRNGYASDAKRKKKHKRRRRVLIIVLIVVVALIAACAVAAFAYINYVNDKLQPPEDPDLPASLEPVEPGEPFYMLLLGTDGSADRDATEEFADSAYRSDSIMLLRVDPQEKKVATVSLHRDILVNLVDYGQQKLNAAYAIGGASYAIKVVSELAGVPISHYAQIDFDGFKEVVDALGGIEVDVPVEIDDDEAGGYLAPGLQTLNGDQALILCRSRHTYDEIGDGDLYRAANQRMVIAAIAKKILDSDPATIIATIPILADYVSTDMSVQDIIDLAISMRGINWDTDFYTGSTPTESQYIGDSWYEILDTTAWKKMMDRIDQGLPPNEEEVVDPTTGIVLSGSGENLPGEAATGEEPAAEPESPAPEVVRSGTVAIRNATDIDGAAAGAAETIASMGYVTDTGNANSGSYPTTVVVYNNPDQAEYAQEIADALGKGVIVQNDNEYLFDTDFLVVLGDDWQ